MKWSFWCYFLEEETFSLWEWVSDSSIRNQASGLFEVMILWLVLLRFLSPAVKWFLYLTVPYVIRQIITNQCPKPSNIVIFIALILGTLSLVLSGSRSLLLSEWVITWLQIKHWLCQIDEFLPLLIDWFVNLYSYILAMLAFPLTISHIVTG